MADSWLLSFFYQGGRQSQKKKWPRLSPHSFLIDAGMEKSWVAGFLKYPSAMAISQADRQQIARGGALFVPMLMHAFLTRVVGALITALDRADGQPDKN